MNQDGELLRRYAVDHSETAFAELVDRYVNLVYSAALRQAGGDPHLAQDISQSVFIDLARKAKKLMGHSSLAGWLYTSVRFAAASARRGRERQMRRERETEPMQMAEQSEKNVRWEQVLPLLDDALHTLREKDREIILLRFFKGFTFVDIGASLGLNENAARKRVERALEKLRNFFDARGVTLSTGALAGFLAAEASSAAPPAIAAVLAKSSLLAAAGNSGVAFSALHLMKISKWQLGGAALTLGLGGLLIYQAHINSLLRAENEALTERISSLSQAAALESRPATTPELRDEQWQELLRLRGEVTMLKRNLSEMRASSSGPAVGSADERAAKAREMTPEMKKGIFKLVTAKVWMGALFQYASNHNGFFPGSFSDAANLLSGAMEQSGNGEELMPDPMAIQEATNHFEIVYEGSLSALQDPPKTIVLREKEPWNAPDGSWMRTYAFADGHSEIHKSADGNFEDWERARWAKRPVSGDQ